MYLVKKTNGSKELNIIVETKGVDVPANLREVEEKKISCAETFFNQLREEKPELNVHFRSQLNNKQVKAIIDEVINGDVIWNEWNKESFFLHINKNVYFCKSETTPVRDVLDSVIIE